MERPGTSLYNHRLRLPYPTIFVALAVIGSYAASGQTSVGPVINASPLIAQGHLEGGINGEGSPRPDGKTPLMLAVEANDMKVIEYLMQHGVDPGMKDVAGETALDLARHRMNHAATDLLSAHALAHPGFSDYYAGKSPVLSVSSARSQSGSPGCAAAHSLVVRITDHDGNPLADAPVRFVVEGSGQYLLTQASSPDSASLLVRSNVLGECRANIHLPKEPNARIHITAVAGNGEQSSKVIFTAMTNDGTGGDSVSCYDPSELQVSMSPTGELDLTWQNNTDDETAIKVWVKLPKGWEVAATLPPHATSAHIPAK